MQFSPCGTRLALISTRRIQACSIPDGALLFECSIDEDDIGHIYGQNPPEGLSFDWHHGESVIIGRRQSADEDEHTGEVHLITFDAKTGSKMSDKFYPFPEVNGVAVFGGSSGTGATPSSFSHNGKLLAVTDGRAHLAVLDVDSGSVQLLKALHGIRPGSGPCWAWDDSMIAVSSQLVHLSSQSVIKLNSEIPVAAQGVQFDRTGAYVGLNCKLAEGIALGCICSTASGASVVSVLQGKFIAFFTASRLALIQKPLNTPLDSTFQVWDLVQGTLLYTFTCSVHDVMGLFLDDAFIVGHDGGSEGSFWRTADGKLCRGLLYGAGPTVAPDERTLAFLISDEETGEPDLVIENLARSWGA